MFSAILAVAPLVVRSIEAVFKGKSGSAKAAKAVEVIDALIPNKKSSQSNDLAKGIAKLIEALVLLYHATGRFQKAKPQG